MSNSQTAKKGRLLKVYKVFSITYTTTTLIVCGIVLASLGVGEIRLKNKRRQEAKQEKSSAQHKVESIYENSYSTYKPKPKADPYRCPYQSHFREN